MAMQTKDQAQDIYFFSDTQQQAVFSKIVHELRCSVCQNQNLSDSMAPLAIDLKNEIYQKVQLHQSEREIIEYITHRYGDFVLYNPPLQWSTVFLWFGPLLVLVIGLLVFAKYIKN